MKVVTTLFAASLATLLVLSAATAQTPAIQQPAADVTIVSSRANQLEFEKRKIDFRKGVTYWAKLCEEAGLTYRIAGDYELETGLQPSKLYILHRTERLTDVQLVNIRVQQKRGASLILVGQIGRFKPDGSTQKSLSEQWLELEEIVEYQPTEAAYFVASAGSLLSLGNPPGFRFEFDWEGVYSLARTKWAAATSVDWSLFPTPNPTQPANNTVIAVRSQGQSRMAWFGVNPDDFLQKGDQQKFTLSTMLNLLNWLVRRPVAEACHWPGCNLAAAVVTGDIEDKFENADAIALACHKEKVRGSFFLVGTLSKDYPEVVAALNANGEIGTHSMKHLSFKDVPFEEQLGELNEGKQVLVDLGVNRVTGFRPPMEDYDDNTLKAVASAGLEFIYGNLVYDRAYPMVARVQGTPIYQFARIVADDYNLVVEKNVTNMKEYKREYLKEFERIFTMGGLFPFSFHTNYLALQDSVDVVRSVIRHLKKREHVLLTTFGTLVDWMEAKRQVRVEVRLDERTSRVLVKNLGTQPVKAFPVHFFPPGDGKRVKLVATPDRGAAVRKAPVAGFVLDVDLEAGEEKELLLQ